MATYSYRSMDGEGKTVRGTMDAANLPDLEMRLKRMGLDLIACKQRGERTTAFGRGKIDRKELINFCFHMEQMTGAGVPILESLADLRDSAENRRFREVMADLMENIEGGMQLSEAMERHPKIFDKTFSSLIRAGEQSGKIAYVFKSLSESLKWQDELAAQTKKIMMYPAFSGTVVLGVTAFLMIYLVPQLTGFIKNMGQELPFHTKVLIAVSGIFIKYWYLLLIVPVATFIIFKLVLKNSAAARYKTDEFKLRIFLIGPVLHKIILARFATFFALMYASGITILEAIRLSEDIVNNEAIAQGLRRAGQMISEGQGVTAAFESAGMFPPLVLRMLRVGESTGSLDTALQNVSYFYNRDIQEAIGKVQAMIPTVMTVTLGLILGWIMLSVLGPIYDTISKIKT